MSGSIGSLIGNVASGVAKTAIRQAQAKVPLTLASAVNSDPSNTTGSSLAAAAGAAASSAAAASTNAAASGTSGSDAQTAKIKSTSEQFEAIFMREMLSEARKSKFDDDDDSKGMSTFTAMQDSHYADVASQHDSLGIAKMLEKSLSHRLGLDATGSATGATGAVASAGAGHSTTTSGISGPAATRGISGIAATSKA